MDNLSATELKVLNNLSLVRHDDVELGTLLNSVISNMMGRTGTPINAVNAEKDLTLTGVVVDGETVTIGADVYEFLTDIAQSKTTPTNIAVNIAVHAVKASVTLTVDTQPTSGDTMTIGTKVYTFVPNGTADGDGQISVGTNLASAKTAIVAAINGSDGYNVAHTLVTAAAFSSNNCTITALVGGTIGNTIASTETFTAGTNIFSAATLGSGADCSAANAIEHFVAAVTASDTQGVGATDEAGDVVKLKADVAGVSGNDISIAETLANATFAGGAVKLSGGVNGTVGYVGQPMVDASYVYFCVADNTIADKNWRRVSLGSAY